MKRRQTTINLDGISINQEYLDLVPRPTAEQYESLKNSIQEDGLQVPITINHEGVVLDGHTRLQACKDLGVQPRFTVKDFDDPQKEKEFVVTANLARRHLNLFQRGEVCFNFYQKERETRYQRSSQKTWAIRRGEREAIPEGPEKREARLLNRFGKMIGVSASLTHKVTWLIENADGKTKELLRTDGLTINKAYDNLRGKPAKKYDHSIYLRHSVCLNCGKKTVSATQTGCHVHTQFCCTACGWGN